MVYGSAIFLCEWLVIVLVATMIGAFILKVSCALCNLLVGAGANSYSPPTPSVSPSIPQTGITTEPRALLVLEDAETPCPRIEIPSWVPKPSFEWAMCIVFAAALVNLVAYFLLDRVLRLAGMATGLNALRSLPMQLIFCPLSFLLHSGMYTAMLPTSFGKGLLIFLIYLMLNALVVAVLFVIGFMIGLAFGLGALRFGLWS
jgi:hypothetical protein